MKRIAIIISSSSGHTRRIAEYAANQLDRHDAVIDVFNVSHNSGPTAAQLGGYDAVMVGCPVYLGDFPEQLIDWTWEHRETINSMPSALFTVSLNAADPRPKARDIDDRVLRNFLEYTDYRPRFVASLAGALEYTQYGFFKRCVLQGISAASGGPTDTSRDFDLTNWTEVARFVQAFHSQDISSEFATVNRLPVAPQPSWPMALSRVA
jgi:menaquinone-dependent protoporphyrinogen oxidase